VQRFLFVWRALKTEHRRTPQDAGEKVEPTQPRRQEEKNENTSSSSFKTQTVKNQSLGCRASLSLCGVSHVALSEMPPKSCLSMCVDYRHS
jgi:hypothetical protein